VILAVAAVALAAASARPPTLLLTPCDVQSVPAGCGTLLVPENRAKPDGRKIGLNVVVVPARHKAEPDAFTYLAGGPGGAATEETYTIVSSLAAVHDRHDIVLVDQRGTGRSHPLECPPEPPAPTAAKLRAYLRSCVAAAPGDMTQYGTRAAADDLDAVRKALGYDQLDVYGVSYGATVAQVYLRRHRSAVRTLILDGATLLQVPFYSRFARNADRALADVARRCAAAPACARAFPHWRQTFDRLVRAWNAHPVHRTPTATIDGDELAGVVQRMLLDPDTAASIPLVVARAAAGRYGPLNAQIEPGTFTRQLMFWSVWCNEPWVGLGVRGPWHTPFDGYTETTLAQYRATCRDLPRRPEPASAWTVPRTTVPLLVLAGGADPQDPRTNLPGLRRYFPDSRVLVVPGFGHGVGQYGCLGGLVSIFVDDAGSQSLDPRCIKAIRPPPFLTR
jgi:pimeloyl-ACP methyl ester carboxylesterase